jgi:acetate kinase
MRILTINCGSSTLKFQLVELESKKISEDEKSCLLSGLVDRIGHLANLKIEVENGDRLHEDFYASDHGAAMKHVLKLMEKLGHFKMTKIDAVGHRVVHGGDRFVNLAMITDHVLEAIEEVSELAPLHNGPSLSAIKATREYFGMELPQVAVFDTAFHSTIPERSSRYAIPYEMADKHRIRRYGFHGLAHRYMAERYAVITNSSLKKTKLITLQLGNGCSITAVDGGQSIDTSMGFTPLEGLIMGTRSGDIDPSLVNFLANKEAVESEIVEKWLNLRSGLLGISGSSKDMRDLLKAEANGDSRASLAIEMFCYRIQKYIGAYLNVLRGTDAIIFGGGIGENSSEIRERICKGMEWCDLFLDREKNLLNRDEEFRISTEQSKIHAYVVRVVEETIIARDTEQCLKSHFER